MNSEHDPVQDSCTTKEKIELMRRFYKVEDRIDILWKVVIYGMCGAILSGVFLALLRLVILPNGSPPFH